MHTVSLWYGYSETIVKLFFLLLPNLNSCVKCINEKTFLISRYVLAIFGITQVFFKCRWNTAVFHGVRFARGIITAEIVCHYCLLPLKLNDPADLLISALIWFMNAALSLGLTNLVSLLFPK